MRDLAKESAEIDLWSKISSEFGRSDLARRFDHVELQWCSGQFFAMRECERMSCLKLGPIRLLAVPVAFGFGLQ